MILEKVGKRATFLKTDLCQDKNGIECKWKLCAACTLHIGNRRYKFICRIMSTAERGADADGCQKCQPFINKYPHSIDVSNIETLKMHVSWSNWDVVCIAYKKGKVDIYNLWKWNTFVIENKHSLPTSQLTSIDLPLFAIYSLCSHPLIFHNYVESSSNTSAAVINSPKRNNVMSSTRCKTNGKNRICARRIKSVYKKQESCICNNKRLW